MKRQVYKRVNEDMWNDVSATFPDPQEKVGFEAIDGYSDKEIYAVGWERKNLAIRRCRLDWPGSPTNVILAAVCCAPNDVVYTAGQQGVLIEGRNDAWEAIQWEDDVTVDLWDLCWFQEKLYVATMTALYTLNGNSLVEVDFGETPVSTCYSLTPAEGVMWSIGRDDVASFDGKMWQRYD